MSEIVSQVQMDEEFRAIAEVLQLKQHMFGNTEIQAVNGRDLHVALEVGKDFSNWIKGKIQTCELEEREDYVVEAVLVNNREGEQVEGKGEQVKNSGAKHAIEYYISLEAAKHISMSCNGSRGKKVRKYFLACEKVAQEKFQEDQKKLEQKTKEQLEIDRFNYRIAGYETLAKILGYSQGEVRNEALKVGFETEKKTGIKVLPSFVENDSLAINPDLSLTPFQGTHAALVGQGTNCTNVGSIRKMFEEKYISTKEINDVLINLGYQTRAIVGQYILTQKGVKFGNTTLVTDGVTKGNNKVNGWDLTFNDFKQELFDEINNRIAYNKSRELVKINKSKLKK